MRSFTSARLSRDEAPGEHDARGGMELRRSTCHDVVVVAAIAVTAGPSARPARARGGRCPRSRRKGAADAQGVEGECIRGVRGRGVRRPLRGLRPLHGRVRAVHRGRRSRSALRGAPRRPVPVPAHGVRDRGEADVHVRGRARGDVRGGRRLLRAARPHPDAPRGLAGRRVQPERRSCSRRWRSWRRTWRPRAPDPFRAAARRCSRPREEWVASTRRHAVARLESLPVLR